MLENTYKLKDVSLLDAKRMAHFNKENEHLAEYREIMPENKSDLHNELATIALVGGINMLVMAAAYFFGKRKKEKITIAVETTKPDGTAQLVFIELDRSSNVPVESQIGKQIEAVLG